MLRVFLWMVKRDVTLALRRKTDMLLVLFFFIVTGSLFPLAIGPDAALLQKIGSGVIWVAALLASLLALDRVFQADYADGTLEQMLLSVEPLSVIVIGKVVAYWLVTGLPLVLTAPLLALQYGLPTTSLGTLCLSLSLGTAILSLLGAMVAALTVGLGGRSMLAPLLLLPLCVPVLIFGAGATAAAVDGASAAAPLLLLAGMLLAALALLPGMIASALGMATG